MSNLAIAIKTFCKENNVPYAELNRRCQKIAASFGSKWCSNLVCLYANDKYKPSPKNLMILMKAMNAAKPAAKTAAKKPVKKAVAKKTTAVKPVKKTVVKKAPAVKFAIVAAGGNPPDGPDGPRGPKHFHPTPIVYGPKYYTFRNMRFAHGQKNRRYSTAEMIQKYCESKDISFSELDRQCRACAESIGATWCKGSSYGYASGRYQPKAEKLNILNKVTGMPMETITGWSYSIRAYKGSPAIQAFVRRKIHTVSEINVE